MKWIQVRKYFYSYFVRNLTWIERKITINIAGYENTISIDDHANGCLFIQLRQKCPYYIKNNVTRNLYES